MSAAASADPADAARRVLSQRELLSLIASFQRGAPGVAAPLLRRLVTDGLVRCRVRVAGFAWWAPWRDRHSISTPLYRDVRPKRAWAELLTPEAIARFDAPDLHALGTVLAAAAFAAKPLQATRRLLHRTTEAAAACGRVGMLRWLHDQRDVFGAQPLLVPFCVKLATRHGQVAVLEWLEAAFSTAALEPLRVYVVHGLVKRGDARTLLWLAERKLGVVSPRSLRYAVEHGDLAVLRLLLDRFGYNIMPDPRGPYGAALVAFASRRGHHAVVEFFVGEHKFGFTATTLEKTIALRHLRVAKCLLSHRAIMRSAGSRSPLVSSSLVQQLVSDQDFPMLAMLGSVPDPQSLGCSVMTCCHFAKPSSEAVRLLLPLSLPQDTCVALMRFAFRRQYRIVDTILEATDKNAVQLPSAVTAFVDRVRSHSLGPLATRAMLFSEKRESAVMDEILANLAKASHEDVRDTVLRFLSGPAFSLTSVLKADAKRAGSSGSACDEPFLQLCLSMRQSESDPHHRAVHQYLHTRKKPRPPNASAGEQDSEEKQV